MSKRQFKSQASSSRAASGPGFGGFGSVSAGSTLSYLADLPNLSALSDANIVVAFKNLTKKDATTKAKALEDLRAYIKEHPFESTGGPEEPILEAWVKLYPRLSIENSRRVREISHNIQYELLKSARKRMERHIPKIVGSWLAGTYDRDRGVARSANDGIASFLDSDSKVIAFWKRCQVQILEYAQETFDENPQTLSDERTVSADEMQEKYFRVVGSSVSLVLNLLVKLNGDDISKYQNKYEDFLSNNKKLWALASCEDSSARRSVDQLLIVCLARQPRVIEDSLEIVSQSFIADALPASQTGSAFHLVQALSVLTKHHPEVWTSAYKSKKPPVSKLRRFVEKGSQGGPPEYWQTLLSLIINLPESILFSDLQTSLVFLEAVRDGISSREETRGNTSHAWSSYFEICKSIVGSLSDSDAAGKLFSEAVYPAFVQHIHPTPANSKWSVGNTTILAKAFLFCVSVEDTEVKTLLKDKWNQLGNDFVVRIQTSLPEQSKDYHKSQASVTTQGHRWFELFGQIIKDGEDPSFSGYLGVPSGNIITTAIDVMLSRDGKPYSAAAIIEAALRDTPRFMSHQNNMEPVKRALASKFSELVISPSSKYLVTALFQIRTFPDQGAFFEKLWNDTLDQLLKVPVILPKTEAITTLMADDKVAVLAQGNILLQAFLFESFSKAIQGDSSAWPVVETAITFDSLTEATTTKVLKEVLSCLDSKSALGGAFKALEILSKKPGLLSSQIMHVALVTKLLALAEISDSRIAPQAIALKSLIESSDKNSEQKGERQSPIVHIIQENLEFVSLHSLSVGTLVQQAKLVMEATNDASILASIFPSVTRWSRELRSLLSLHPNSALAVMRPFAGSVFLVTETTETTQPASRSQKDLNGYSIALRMAMYTASLLSEVAFKSLPRRTQVEVLYLLCLTSELATGHIDLQEDNELFDLHQELDSINNIRDFLANTQASFVSLATDSRSWRRSLEDAAVDTFDSSATTHELIFKLIGTSASRSATSYYSAKALYRILSKLVDAHGWQTEGGEEWLARIDVLNSSTTNHFGAISLLTGLGENLDSSKLVNNLCNRLISDVAGASAQAEKTLQLLVLLNSTLAIYDETDLPVAKNRIVFAVKQILSWTKNLAATDTQLASEACRALQKLLPAIQSVYGDYWETTLSFCISIWNSSSDGKLSDDRIPMVGMSLKLFLILQNLEEANDDLQDSLVEVKDQASQSLIKLLQLRRTRGNQPLEFVDSLLSRLIMHVPSSTIVSHSELYPLLASDFPIVQSAAYSILSKALPEAQRHISVDVLLENTDARLPEELLSLLLDAPSMQNFSDDEIVEFPTSIRGYLLSWHLVFASYPDASYKVRNDYTEILKSENYVNPLLDFLFDALGHSRARPLNLDKARFDEERIRQFNIWDATESESNERAMQLLLVNLYYLALKFTPNLVKGWWLDCKSKQTRNAVESWTQKYFAPLVIQDTLDGVNKWAEEQESAVEDEKELIIKVVKRAREIYAGYEVDDMTVQIVIRLPPNYPLEGVKVEGINRVAASEKKWASWLMITQGAITFSNGSITDGLVIFRKNVIGALKGQTECAICYSIISADKKMPDKRCQTCKNLFHSGCLFKWFASSNQNTCPLCRNPFNYASGSMGKKR